jgi:hypothetical protein
VTAQRLLWLKMRPDTPQNYEYITVEDITGNGTNFLYIQPWTQFFDLKGQPAPPPSRSSHITMRNIKFECDRVFNVSRSEKYTLTNFTFEGLELKAKQGEIATSMIDNFTLKNVTVNGQKVN